MTENGATTTLPSGVYGILATTYDASDQPLHADLTAQAEFVAATAQGVVWPVMASEFYVLRREEVGPGIEAVARGVRGRVPFVAGVSQLTTADSVELAEAARVAGADAIIAMPPWMVSVKGADLLRYYQALAEVGLPIVVQNVAGAKFSAMAEGDLRLIIEKVPEIVALKDEAPVLPQTITRGLRLMPPERGKVFGGGGARFLLDELRRGGAGNMAGSFWVDLLGAAFVRWTAGDEREARRLYAAAQVGHTVVAAYGRAAARWILHRRGITSSVRGRFDAGGGLDEAAIAELEAVVTELQPLLD